MTSFTHLCSACTGSTQCKCTRTSTAYTTADSLLKIPSSIHVKQHHGTAKTMAAVSFTSGSANEKMKTSTDSFHWSVTLNKWPKNVMKGHIACHDIIGERMIPFTVYTAGETLNAFQWVGQPPKLPFLTPI